MKILIAEDDTVSRLLLQALLQQGGHEVVAACDGDEALKLLNGKDAPSLAILDWIMPGATGVEICRVVRADKNLSDRYLILLTSNDCKEDIIEGLRAGANDYVIKPFDPNELRARIEVGRRVVELQTSLLGKIAELEDALAHIKTLQGILPICMHCHKIRNDQDAWEKLEQYLGAHSGAQFTHGLCPDCFEKFYPKPKAKA